VEAGNIYLAETDAFPNGRHDDQVDAMTQALNRMRTSYGNFSVPESQIVEDPFGIPAEWPRAFGMAVMPHAVAAIWGARDPGGTIHLYAEHHLPHGEPSENARAIRKVGDWISGMINFSGLKGGQAEKNRLRQIYGEQGLKIQSTMQGEEAGVYQLLQLLAANKLKVFASLSGLLVEYRIGDEQAPLLLCCHALLHPDCRMRIKPVIEEFLPWAPRNWKCC